MYEFFKNHPQRIVLHNVNSSNLENVLQRNVRTDRFRKCILRVSGGTNLKNFFCPAPTMVGPSWVQCMYQSAQKNFEYATVYLSKLMQPKMPSMHSKQDAFTFF